MKKFAVLTLLAAFIAAPAMAELALVDTFSQYTDGQSLKNVDGWGNTSNHGGTPYLDDPGNLTIASDGGNKYLVLSNNDAQGSGDLLFGASGAALDIPDIEHQGTIYMRIKLDPNQSLAITTNGRDETFCADNGATPCQTVSGWGDQASINNFEIGTSTGPYAFRARDDNAYVNSPTSTYNDGIWYDYWIQIDVDNQLSRYYMRELGSIDLPVAMLDAGGSPDWTFRNQTYSSITTLKFNISGSPDWSCDTVPGGVDDPAKANCQYAAMLVDSIAVDTTAMSFCTVPEPASLSLIALGSLAMIRRR